MLIKKEPEGMLIKKEPEEMLIKKETKSFMMRSPACYISEGIHIIPDAALALLVNQLFDRRMPTSKLHLNMVSLLRPFHIQHLLIQTQASNQNLSRNHPWMVHLHLSRSGRRPKHLHPPLVNTHLNMCKSRTERSSQIRK